MSQYTENDLARALQCKQPRLLSNIAASQPELLLVRSAEGKNALHRACEMGNPILINCILDNTNDSKLPALLIGVDAEGNLPLHYACMHTNEAGLNRVFEIYNTHCTDELWRLNSHAESPLLLCLKHNTSHSIYALITKFIVAQQLSLQSLAQPDEEHQHCLHYAAGSPTPEALQYFIEYFKKKLDVERCEDVSDDKDESDDEYDDEQSHLAQPTLLQEAINTSLQLLFTQRSCKDGATPLHIAIRSGAAESVKIILDFAKEHHFAEALLRITDHEGFTPLHLCMHLKNTKIPLQTLIPENYLAPARVASRAGSTQAIHKRTTLLNTLPQTYQADTNNYPTSMIDVLIELDCPEYIRELLPLMPTVVQELQMPSPIDLTQSRFLRCYHHLSNQSFSTLLDVLGESASTLIFHSLDYLVTADLYKYDDRLALCLVHITPEQHRQAFTPNTLPLHLAFLLLSEDNIRDVLAHIGARNLEIILAQHQQTKATIKFFSNGQSITKSMTMAECAQNNPLLSTYLQGQDHAYTHLTEQALSFITLHNYIKSQSPRITSANTEPLPVSIQNVDEGSDSRQSSIRQPLVKTTFTQEQQNFIILLAQLLKMSTESPNSMPDALKKLRNLNQHPVAHENSYSRFTRHLFNGVNDTTYATNLRYLANLPNRLLLKLFLDYMHELNAMVLTDSTEASKILLQQLQTAVSPSQSMPHDQAAASHSIPAQEQPQSSAVHVGQQSSAQDANSISESADAPLPAMHDIPDHTAFIQLIETNDVQGVEPYLRQQPLIILPKQTQSRYKVHVDQQSFVQDSNSISDHAEAPLPAMHDIPDQSAFIQLIEANDVQGVERYLRQQPRIILPKRTQLRYKNTTPLHAACQQGNPIIIELILAVNTEYFNDSRLFTAYDEHGVNPIYYLASWAPQSLLDKFYNNMGRTIKYAQVHRGTGESLLQQLLHNCKFKHQADIMAHIGHPSHLLHVPRLNPTPHTPPLLSAMAYDALFLPLLSSIIDLNQLQLQFPLATITEQSDTSAASSMSTHSAKNTENDGQGISAREYTILLHKNTLTQEALVFAIHRLLIHAIQTNNSEIVKILLKIIQYIPECGPVKKLIHNSKMSLLHHATLAGQDVLLRIYTLFSAPGEFEAELKKTVKFKIGHQEFSVTPTELAIIRQNPVALKQFLQKAASCDTSINNFCPKRLGFNPLQLVCRFPNLDTLQVLRQHYTPEQLQKFAQERTADGHTALHYAVRHGDAHFITEMMYLMGVAQASTLHNETNTRKTTLGLLHFWQPSSTTPAPQTYADYNSALNESAYNSLIANIGCFISLHRALLSCTKKLNKNSANAIYTIIGGLIQTLTTATTLSEAENEDIFTSHTTHTNRLQGLMRAQFTTVQRTDDYNQRNQLRHGFYSSLQQQKSTFNLQQATNNPQYVKQGNKLSAVLPRAIQTAVQALRSNQGTALVDMVENLQRVPATILARSLEDYERYLQAKNANHSLPAGFAQTIAKRNAVNPSGSM